jgi:hypothetical protein
MLDAGYWMLDACCSEAEIPSLEGINKVCPMLNFLMFTAYYKATKLK